MNDATSKSEPQKGRMRLFLFVVVVGALIGFYVYWPRDEGEVRPRDEVAAVDETAAAKPQTPESAPPRLTPVDVQKLTELKDVSLGHLENGPTPVEVDGKKVSGMDVAADGFARLAAQVPGERLPLQNLAITRLLLLKDPPSDVVVRREQAREAAQRLLDFDPDSAVAHWIAASVEMVPDTTNPLGATDEMREKAVTLLKRATQLEPENAVFWLALSRAATRPRDTEPSELAKSALRQAYTVNPRNIYLITEWLLTQAKTRDPEITDTLAAARPVLAPLTATMKYSKVDVNQLLDRAAEAAAEGDWKKVDSRTRVIHNVTRPEEVAKSDITRVDVHPLEYLLYDFSAEFYAANPLPEPAWTATTPVKLTVAEGRLPELSGVLDMLVMDFDLDGLPDVAVLQPGKLTLFAQTQRGADWAELASLEVPDGLHRMLAADLDTDRRKAMSVPTPSGDPNAAVASFDRVLSDTGTCHDADPDIILYGEAGVLIVRNDTEVEGDQPKLAAVACEGLEQLTQVTAGVLADVDHDADLDLLFSSAQGITIWSATGKLAYQNVSQWSQLPPADVAVTSMVAVDWDRDVDIDIVLVEPTGQVVGVLENMRHAEFRWTPFDAAFEALHSPSSVAVLEADGNVSWDLLSAGANGVQLCLTATPRSRIVNYMRTQQIDSQPCTGALDWDFDNDGFRDVVAWGTSGLTVYRGGPGGSFQPANLLEGGLDEPVQVVCCSDLDRDGDQDLLVATATRVVMLINEGGNENSWFTLYPMGQEDNAGRCNHSAIGSMVELRAGGRYQAQVVAQPSVHFGLGQQEVAQLVRILWTNGVPQDMVEIGGRVAVCERMLLKGSCPYIYTMADGRFSFFSDCLWAAPLGLQTARGEIQPTRAWEYLHIPGERLTPSEGSYWIMFTEELWEAGYFDFAELIAVDHPADVEIYSNEKVGPPDIAEFKIHTVRTRRFPERAVDPRGRDLRAQLQHADGDFVKAFDKRIRQGLTPEHYIELDLGPLQDPQQITLFLTGWIFPTDTSLNVAFLQDPETDGPRMPSVWVPDASGQWQETIGFMGFPGGKTKTIAVDLSQAFLTADYRLRIQTSAEIYWDEVFFTVDEAPVEVRQTRLAVQSADLAYRGCSEALPTPENSPRMYDYDKVIRPPVWPPMRGWFTRYGPVSELLAEADDQMVVIGAGDALTVRFKAPDTPLPDGWKRDFLLYSIGYDKDADLNTVYGQTADPLPFQAMRSYPFGPDDEVPDSPEYRDFLQRYQTREQDPCAFWRHLMLPSRP